MSNKKRFLISVSGYVQGVGFRPFVFRLAQKYHLVGSIKNTHSGVQIDVQGIPSDLIAFQQALIDLKPKHASIQEKEVEEVPLHDVTTFEIQKSTFTSDPALALLPDTAMCRQCLQEFNDPENRRYLYPFIHCTGCGPRFSLFLRTPFDRENTSMRHFTMCYECQHEYTHPDNRRFYSQTNCCSTCGPKLCLLNSHQELLAENQEAVSHAITSIQEGKIIAVKNTGGYLLLVDATNEQAVQRLRSVKKRAKKPFAILVEDISHAKRLAKLNVHAENVLTSPAAPIVLLEKTFPSIAPSVVCESPYYGIMLAHNGLQYLLLRGAKKPLVATSGNISNQPLCITEEEAFAQLSSIAELFLVHNRPIIHRLDDSVIHMIADKPMLLRKGRGYIPYVLSLPTTLKEPILAVGGHQKNSFALYTNNRLYLSQHLGDLDSVDACQAYEQEVKSWTQLLHITPSKGVGDKHPMYYTSLYLQNSRQSHTSIQHHKAHIFSCLLDNQLFSKKEPLLCFSWDGTGWGDDHTIWGGEAFIASENNLQRFASLYPFKLPGGEKAVQEPRRAALGVLHALFGETTFAQSFFTDEEYAILLKALKKEINSPICSSVGRLFDAVSALLGYGLINQFEGEAAMKLEASALSCHPESHLPIYQMQLIKEKSFWLLDWRPMILQILEDIKMVCPEAISLAFHHSLVQSMIQLAQKASLKKILLTGGVMQNKLLLENAIVQFEQAGLEPFWHHQIPPNDGGLAAGQMMGKLQCV